MKHFKNSALKGLFKKDQNSIRILFILPEVSRKTSYENYFYKFIFMPDCVTESPSQQVGWESCNGALW